jgi:hypothetical protein
MNSGSVEAVCKRCGIFYCLDNFYLQLDKGKYYVAKTGTNIPEKSINMTELLYLLIDTLCAKGYEMEEFKVYMSLKSMEITIQNAVEVKTENGEVIIKSNDINYVVTALKSRQKLIENIDKVITVK